MTGSEYRLYGGLSGQTEHLEKEAPPRKRVLLAGLHHQTNTFVGGRTGLEDFEIARGEEILRGSAYAPYVAGVLEVAEGRGWEVLPVLDARAVPGPTIADAVVDLFWAEFRAVADTEVATGGIDGVFLVLHGSAVSESLADVEGDVLRRIRSIGHLSDAPICGVMDPRANFTEAMARQSDGLIACRENPPTDMREATRDAALLLDGLMETLERPATVREHPPIMWPPSGAATDSEPMASLEARAREVEAELPDVLALNVLAGFPYADVPEAGVSFSAVTTGDLEMARAGLRELNTIATARREESFRFEIPLEEAMLRLQGHDEGPVLIVEPSDAVEAGAPGDSTRVLRAFVEYGVPDAGVIINDPESVWALEDAAPGDLGEVVIGGKSSEAGAEPLPLQVEIVAKGDGRFVPEDGTNRTPYLFGGWVDMGPCCVVRYESVTVLLTSRRTPPFDLGQWRCQGVDPEDLFAIGVKAAVEHRPAYAPIAKASYAVDLPGPCPEDLRRLPFERVSRPIYPLDEL
jgi:microcystin degradation protein MlrC